MNGYLAFLKKEMTEYARNYKLLVMLLVFAAFGIANPLVAKLMPEILKSLDFDGMVIICLNPPLTMHGRNFSRT